PQRRTGHPPFSNFTATSTRREPRHVGLPSNGIPAGGKNTIFYLQRRDTAAMFARSCHTRWECTWGVTCFRERSPCPTTHCRPRPNVRPHRAAYRGCARIFL